MTDNERLGKIWNYLTNRLAKMELGDNRDYDDYEWGMRTAFEEVLDFMDDLMD